MSTVVIGVCGPARSGKTTVSKYLERRYGARIYALAEPLKEIIQRAFLLEPQQLWGPQDLKEKIDPRYNVSPRWLMQRIGTEGFRSVIGDDFWVNYTIQQIRKDAPRLAVVEDVRFLSEAHGLHTLPHSFIWRLHKPGHVTTGHQSETEWQMISAHHILEPKTVGLEELYLEVDRACAKFNIQPILDAIEAP